MRIIKPIRVMVAGKASLFVEAICKILEDEKNTKIVAQASNPSDTIRYCEKAKPDVLLLDTDIPDLYVKKTLRLIKEESPQTKVLLLVKYYTEETFKNLLLDNVKGYITKTEISSPLIEAIETISMGEFWIGRVKEGFKRQKLTRRESEIAGLVTKGYGNKDIAKKLLITERTVKAYLTAIFKKLGIRSRYELILYYNKR